MDQIIIPLIFLLIGITFAYFLFRPKTDSINNQYLHQRLDSLNQNVTENLNSVTKNLLTQMNNLNVNMEERLKTTGTMLEKSNRNIGERLDNAAKSYATVTNHLSKLEESTKQIFDIGKDVAGLHDILRAPKLRGSLSELLLSELLEQILPTQHYKLQHPFKNGTKVDAAITLRDNRILAVDAKFPLENFRKMLENEEDSKKFRKQFLNDVKKHIDSISQKYILEDEGTLDFALMYIPAENIYYEVIIKDSDTNLTDYAINKKVIPVSPNTFYLYLRTILMGLKGMQIEKRAGEIAGNLNRLKQEFLKFDEEFTLMGKHLSNAKNSYDKSDRTLEKFEHRLDLIGEAEEEVKVIENKI